MGIFSTFRYNLFCRETMGQKAFPLKCTVQDFPHGGGGDNPKVAGGRGTSLLFWSFVPEKCIKFFKNWTERGGHPGSATGRSLKRHRHIPIRDWKQYLHEHTRVAKIGEPLSRRLVPCVLYTTGVSSVLIKGSANLLSFLTTRLWRMVPQLYEGAVLNFTCFWCAAFFKRNSNPNHLSTKSPASAYWQHGTCISKIKTPRERYILAWLLRK